MTLLRVLCRYGWHKWHAHGLTSWCESHGLNDNIMLVARAALAKGKP